MSSTSRDRQHERTDGPFQLVRTQTILTEVHTSLTSQNQNMPRMNNTGEKNVFSHASRREVRVAESKDHQQKNTDGSHQQARPQTLLADAKTRHDVRDFYLEDRRRTLSSISHAKN